MDKGMLLLHIHFSYYVGLVSLFLLITFYVKMRKHQHKSRLI